MTTCTITSNPTILALAATVGIVLTSPSARAEAIAFYNEVSIPGFGPQATPDANSWGGSNKTNTSVIFEAFIDFTPTVAAATDPFTIFENGADAVGSGIAFDGDNIIFAAGGSSVANTAVATGAHGLTAGQTNVQILAVIEFSGGTDTNELLSLYVNGTLVATADSATGNDWAGVNTSNLGTSDAFNIFEKVPSLNPTDANNQVFAGAYPDTNTTITFAAYELGVGDNTVENILVPAAGIRLVITAIDYSPDDDMLTLTWTSIPGEQYAVKFSGDMSNWDSDLDDGIPASEGETTTETFNLSDAGLVDAPRVYFRVEKQANG